MVKPLAPKQKLTCAAVSCNDDRSLFFFLAIGEIKMLLLLLYYHTEWLGVLMCVYNTIIIAYGIMQISRREENGKIFFITRFSVSGETVFKGSARASPKYPLFFIVTRVKQPKRPLPELVVMISTSTKKIIYINYKHTYGDGFLFFFKGPHGCLKNIII